MEMFKKFLIKLNVLVVEKNKYLINFKYYVNIILRKMFGIQLNNFERRGIFVSLRLYDLQIRRITMHEDYQNGCGGFLVFPLTSFWVMVVMAFIDIRVCLGALIGAICSGIIFYLVKKEKDMMDRFHISLISGCVLATVGSLILGITIIKSIVFPIVILPGVVLGYVLIYNVKNVL